MPDKKLTDNEIVKALKICGTYKGKCTDCPAFIKVDRSNCKQVLLGAIEIINRQNEQLKANFDSRQTNECENIDVARFEAEITRKKEEIEELKSAINGFRGYEDKIKAKAYKEFADRLKERVYKGGVHPTVEDEFMCDIDNLVKEMVGEDK